MHRAQSTSHPDFGGTQRSAFSSPAAQFALPSGVTVQRLDSTELDIERLLESAVSSFDGARCSSVHSDPEEEPLKHAAFLRPTTSENVQSMGTMGSPFDAPHPRFQQAAAHLSSLGSSSSSKKPPLSPSLPESKSLKAYDERQERQTLADFSQSKSLERNPSFTRRRQSRQDLAFPQANSLASVLEHSAEPSLASMPSSSSPEPLLNKLPSLVSLGPGHLSSTRSFFSQRLPGLLAATGMLLLLVMSIVALWPPANGTHITLRVQEDLDQTSFPKKVLDRLFGSGSNGEMQLEHFTAAQGAGLGIVGFGPEDPSTPNIDQTHPAEDFKSFVSTHLGFEPEEQFGAQQGQSRADFVAAFQKAEAENAHHGRPGGFGEELISAEARGQEQQQPKAPKSLEGRKELEGDGSATTGTTATAAGVNSGMGIGSNGGINIGQSGTSQTTWSSASLNSETTSGSKGGKGSVGVIPQESIRPTDSQPLAGSTGIADPKNLGGGATTGIAANPQTSGISSSMGAGGGTNTSAQLNSASSTSGDVVGTVTSSSSSGSGSGSSGVQSTQSMAGRIAVQPNTGGGINTAAGTNSGTTAAVGTNAGNTASGLRHNSAGQGRAGGAASSTTPLDTMANGQVTSVAASELSSSRQTGREQGLVGQSMQGTFKPLSGRKLKFV